MTTIKTTANKTWERFWDFVDFLVSMIWGIVKDVFWCLAGFFGTAAALTLSEAMLRDKWTRVSMEFYGDEILLVSIVVLVSVIVMKVRNRRK